MKATNRDGAQIASGQRIDLEVIDPIECVSCGRKRSYGGRPCRDCLENARQEADEARHRDRLGGVNSF